MGYPSFHKAHFNTIVSSASTINVLYVLSIRIPFKSLIRIRKKLQELLRKLQKLDKYALLSDKQSYT